MCKPTLLLQFFIPAGFFVQNIGEESAIDLDIGPAIDPAASKNYRIIKCILERLTRLAMQEHGGSKKPKKHEQRLLRNMGAHAVVLELLQIPFEKVRSILELSVCHLTTLLSVIT